MKANLQVARIVLLAGLAMAALQLGGCMWLFNTDPVARFTATPGTGPAPLDVWFDATTSSDEDAGDTLTFSWSFGDGTHGVGMTLSHRFSSPGIYQVDLTVDDGWGGTAGATLNVSVTEQTGTYYAIVVGIADYYQNPLQYTDDDAYDFANLLLQSPSMWDAGNIILLLNRDATTTNFITALNAISAQATANDTLVIFYSGHGGQWADIAPFDEADGYDESLCFIDVDMTDDQLAWLLSSVPVSKLLVLVDACFSGGMIRAASEDATLPHSIGVGLGEDLVSPSNVATKDLGDLSRNVVVISASADYEYSIEWPDFKNGVFTYYLLDAMSGPADFHGNRDGLISAEECFAYLAPNVINFTTSVGQVHHPQLLDNSTGELVFAE